jgi:hypothetical protein
MRRPVPEYPWLSAVQCTTRIRSVSSNRLVKSGAADRAGRGGAVEAAVEPPIRGDTRCALRSGRHNVISIHATTSVTSPRRPRRHAGVVKNRILFHNTRSRISRSLRAPPASVDTAQIRAMKAEGISGRRLRSQGSAGLGLSGAGAWSTACRAHALEPRA